MTDNRVVEMTYEVESRWPDERRRWQVVRIDPRGNHQDVGPLFDMRVYADIFAIGMEQVDKIASNL